MWRWEGVKKMWRWEDVKMRRWADVKMRRREDVRMWRCEDVRMRGCEDVQMRRCEDVRMWIWEDVKMNRYEDVKMWRWEDVKMTRCEDEKMWRFEDVMWRCEDVKMFDRPPLLEEPFAQTLSGKIYQHIEAGQAGDSGLLVCWSGLEDGSKCRSACEARSLPGLAPALCLFECHTRDLQSRSCKLRITSSFTLSKLIFPAPFQMLGDAFA